MTTATDIDFWKAQASYRFGPNSGAMLNVRAGNLHDLGAEVRTLPEVVGDLVTAAEMLCAESVGSLPGSVPPVDTQSNTTASATYTHTAPAAGQTATSPYACSHGARVRKSGGQGKDSWEGYFCPLMKSDPNRCQPYYPGRN